MAEEDEAGHGKVFGGMTAPPDQTEAIYAAMMEDLGIARKDTLPLEGKKDTGGHVDLDALDREKKANDPRTAEFRITQKNASARSAWKNAVFDDVDKADLELDIMNSGQSHRQRMSAELKASSSSRGGSASRSGRGGQPGRKGGSHSVARPTGSGARSSARQDRDDFSGILARVEENSVSQRRATGGMIEPKPSLSFNDNRSVNELTFHRDVPDKAILVSDRGGKKRQQVPKKLKLNNYNQGFALASPEDFLAQNWTNKTEGNVLNDNKKENISPTASLDQARKPQTKINSISGTEIRDIAANRAPFITSTNVKRLYEIQTGESLLDSNIDILHSALIQVGKEFEGNIFTIGSGTVCIKAVNQNSHVDKVIQVEVLGKKLVEEPLCENFEFKLKDCEISFYSGFEGRGTKWILTASLPEIVANFAENLIRLKPKSTSTSSLYAPTGGYAGDVATANGEESLISFSEEDIPPTQAVSQFSEDLFCLMGDQFIEDAAKAITTKTGQKSTTTLSKIHGASEGKVAQKLQKPFRGLATSRFANDVEVGDLYNKSVIFQKPQDSTAVYTKGQVSNKFFEESRKDACPQVLQPVKEQTRIRYSVEKLLSLRKQPTTAEELSPLEAFSKFPTKHDSRLTSSLEELEDVTVKHAVVPKSETNVQSSSSTISPNVRIVSDHKTTQNVPGFVNSEYNGRLGRAIAQESTNSKLLEPSTSKLTSESTYPGKPEPRALRPIQGLSSSRYASPSTEARSLSHSEAKKSETISVKRKQELSSSKDPPTYAVKAFQSFLNPYKTKLTPRGPKLPEELPVSTAIDVPFEQDLLEPSISTSSKSTSSEPPQRLSTQTEFKPHVAKPIQGLASSNYASVLTTMHGGRKTGLLAEVQSGPYNPASVTELAISKAAAPEQKAQRVTQTCVTAGEDMPGHSISSVVINTNERKEREGQAVDSKMSTGIGAKGPLPSPESGDLITLGRSDSLKSHGSKDSNDTKKPSMPKPIIDLVHDQSVSHRFSSPAFGHQPIISIDSSASSQSFVTAIEEKSATENALVEKYPEQLVDAQSLSSQARTSDITLLLEDVTRVESVGKEPYKKSPNMSEFVGDSFTCGSQPDQHDITPTAPFKPLSLSITPVRKPIVKGKGGLLSSIYANVGENIASPVMEGESQHSSPTASDEINKGPSTEKHTANSPILEAEQIVRSRVLKPTASQFMPSARNLTTPTRNLLTPAVNTFSQPVQPIMATVLVQDPQMPGILREVSGLLKMGSAPIPIVGYIPAQNSPMGESIAASPAPASALRSRKASLTPVGQESQNIKEKQQEIQERLTKSLAQRRPSGSPDAGAV